MVESITTGIDALTIQEYKPLIIVGSRVMSKYVVLEMFAYAFFSRKLIACFNRLNNNFHSFSSKEQELIQKIAMHDELARLLQFRMPLGANDRLYNKSLVSQFFKCYKCPIELKTSYSTDDVWSTTLNTKTVIPQYIQFQFRVLAELPHFSMTQAIKFSKDFPLKALKFKYHPVNNVKDPANQHF